MLNHWIAEYGGEPELAARFKKKGSHTVGRYIPQRLKLSANAEGCQMSGYLKQKVQNLQIIFEDIRIR